MCSTKWAMMTLRRRLVRPSVASEPRSVRRPRVCCVRFRGRCQSRYARSQAERSPKVCLPGRSRTGGEKFHGVLPWTGSRVHNHQLTPSGVGKCGATPTSSPVPSWWARSPLATTPELRQRSNRVSPALCDTPLSCWQAWTSSFTATLARSYWPCPIPGPRVGPGSEGRLHTHDACLRTHGHHRW